jgi:hypothetical protein
MHQNTTQKNLEDCLLTILVQKNTVLFYNCRVTIKRKVIWAGTDDGNVQVTKDGGKTWTNVVANITGLQKTLGVITLSEYFWKE